MIINSGAITAISSHIASGTYDSCGIGGSPFKTDKEYITIISILSWFVILILGWIPLAPYIFNNFMDSCVSLWVSSMGGLLYPVITFIFVIWIKELVSYNKRKKNMKTNYSAEISSAIKTIKKQSMELTIEKIQECKKVKEFLDDVCEKYFNTHAPDWKCYGGWKFSDNYPNCIVAHYGYYDYRDNYETGDEVIPMDVLIEFSKKYEYDTQ